MARPGNRQRQLPLQGKLSGSATKKEEEKRCPDLNLTRKPYSEVAHFSVKKPAQFRVKINKVIFSLQKDCRPIDDDLPWLVVLVSVAGAQAAPESCRGAGEGDRLSWA